MSWPRLPQEAKACKFRLVNECLVLLKLADTVLILINTGRNVNVNFILLGPMLIKINTVSANFNNTRPSCYI